MDLIILGVVAVFLVFRLFTMIGQDLGGNMDAFKQESDAIENEQNKVKQDKKQKPEITIEAKSVEKEKASTIVIEKIIKEYPDFNRQNFINGAVTCFNNTIENFALGNKDALKELLSPATYKVFEKVVDERTKNGEVVKDEIVGIVSVKIISANTTGKTIDVEVEFISDQINVVFDSSERIIAGHPNDIVRITDNWLFSRDKKSTQLNWYVKETS